MSFPPGHPFRYKAFISYNHRDLKFAKHLHRKLEAFSFRPSKQMGKGDKPLHPVFLDENELKAGSTLSEAIQHSIRESEYLIVICSANSVQSKWVKAELAFMKSLNREHDIIGVIPDKNGDETHLAALFGAKSEHLAADFRSGKNKNLQLSKIAATVMGVELDEIYQRETRRKNKQMMTGVAGLSAVAMVMSTLAANAYFSEKEAVRQRQNSEEVIAFMIDEFREDLEKLDKLDLLSDVGEKAQEYFEDRDLNSLSDESVILQSRTLRQLSDVDEKRGEIGAARARMKTAHLASETILERLPKHKDAISEHAENSDYLGYLEYQLGNLEDAQNFFQSANDIYETGEDLFPEEDDFAWKNAVGELNVGIMILQQGRTAEARPYLERTLRSVETYYEANSLNEDRLYEYAGMYTWYIRSLPDDTPISLVHDTRQKQLNLFQDMRENGARTILNQSETLNVQRAVVILLLHSGRDDEAKTLMHSIQEEFKTLLEHDPNNVGWRRHLMRSKLTLALLHDKYGRENARNQELDEVIELTKKENGETWGLTTDIDRRMNRLKAYRLYDEGSTDAALQHLEKAEQKIIDYRQGNLNPRVRYTLASLKSFEAELLTKENRIDDVQNRQRRVLELLLEKNSFSIAEQKLLLSAYVDLKMEDEARELREKMIARGVMLE